MITVFGRMRTEQTPHGSATDPWPVNSLAAVCNTHEIRQPVSGNAGAADCDDVSSLPAPSNSNVLAGDCDYMPRRGHRDPLKIIIAVSRITRSG